MSRKLTTVEIEVPYKRSGGIISQQTVAFDVFQVDGHYQLKPCLSIDERRVANLPETLNFTIEDGKPVSLRGKMDGNFHVIEDAVRLLQKREQST
ncbi:MAG TPA: hypothetical protein VGN63_17260 [Flavisolibacter sp.]|jgi:hypothetical protein|nr:hypothetical protein [Flavisolibacter sp.]